MCHVQSSMKECSAPLCQTTSSLRRIDIRTKWKRLSETQVEEPFLRFRSFIPPRYYREEERRATACLPHLLHLPDGASDVYVFFLCS